MKRRKSRDVRIEVEKPKARNFNPHNRARVIPNNKHKIYNRKAQSSKAEPSDFLVLLS